MGLFKDLKNMKDTVHAAPDMIRPANELGAAPGIGTPGVVTPPELGPIAGGSTVQPIVELDVLVTRGAEPPYPVTIRQMIPSAQPGLVAPGATIAVKVDPANPSTVLL
jgi:hypothetical protein